MIDLAADRTPMITQAQSLNIFIPADIHKRDLHRLHFDAWKKGVKSLYYCRSKSIQRAEVVSNIENGVAKVSVNGNGVPKPDDISIPLMAKPEDDKEENEYDECLACQ